MITSSSDTRTLTPTSSSPELGMSSQNSATLLVKLTFDPAVSTSTAVLPCQEAPEYCSSVSLKSARLSAAKNTLYPPGKTACFRQALCLPQSQLSARRSCTPEPRCRLSLSAAAIRLARRVVATDCAAWGLVKQDAATRPCPHSPHPNRKRKRRLTLTFEAFSSKLVSSKKTASCKREVRVGHVSAHQSQS